MWVDACTVDLGPLRAGIRTNTGPSAVYVRDALARHVVDDPSAPKNFSVRFSDTADDAHLLFWGGCVAARSFDPDRIARSLVDHLAAHRPPPEGLVWVSALPYVRDGRVVLMPSTFKDDVRIVDRQLRAAGFVAVDAPRSLVDLRAGELVVADLLAPDEAALARVGEGVVRRRAEPTVPFGRYPIERWVFVDYTGTWGPVTRASATRAAVLEILDGIDHPDADLLATVAELFRTVRATSMFPDRPSAMVDAVLDRPPPA